MRRRALQNFQAFVRSDLHAFLIGAFAELNPQTRFLVNWHIELIAAKLEAVWRGEFKRLIINLPPRNLKSHCASIAFPAWILGHNSNAQIITVSYAQDLADKHARDSRALMSSRFYKTKFATGPSPQKHATAEYETTARGFRLSSSVGGVLTGRGADFILIDDPLKPDEALSEAERNGVNAWYKNTLLSRLNNKVTGVIVIIMQRLHEDDLVGHVLQLEPDEWEVLTLPAIAETDEVYEISMPTVLAASAARPARRSIRSTSPSSCSAHEDEHRLLSLRRPISAIASAPRGRHDQARMVSDLRVPPTAGEFIASSRAGTPRIRILSSATSACAPPGASKAGWFICLASCASASIIPTSSERCASRRSSSTPTSFSWRIALRGRSSSRSSSPRVCTASFLTSRYPTK